MSTQAAIIDVIRAAGVISRAGITEQTGLTGATVSTVVRRLLDEDLVVEHGRAESTGGKPRVLLRLNPTSRFAVGVQLDHSGITYVLTSLAGTVIEQMARVGVGQEDPPVVIERMAREIDALVQRADVDRSRILGIGLVSPGPIAPAGGMRLTPPAMRHWESFPLDRAMQDVVGLPVLLDNDATAAALGEHWAGRAGPQGTFAALYVGTGIGAGIIINGTAYAGVSGNAGEVGHICVDPDGPDCWCGARGCVEAIGGPVPVVEAARADPDIRAAAELNPDARHRGTVSADFAAVARVAADGHAGARRLLEGSAATVAIAACTLANVLDIDLVVLTGPAMAAAGSLYAPVVQAELDRAFFPRASHGVKAAVSPVARTAAAVGAAAMVLQSELVPPPAGLRLPTAPEVATVRDGLPRGVPVRQRPRPPVSGP